MADTTSDLLGGVCDMLVAVEIVAVVGAKRGTSLDTKCLNTATSEGYLHPLYFEPLNVIFVNTP